MKLYRDRRRAGSAGFTLVEIILVLAVMAILAGVMAPYALREIDAAKREATQLELSGIESGLLAYYRDCGDLPRTATGLDALVQNIDSRAGWDGPYISGKGDLITGVGRDAWGGDYIYVLNPNVWGATSPPDFIVISAGDNGVMDSVQRRTGWVLDLDEDIVLQGVTQAVDGGWAAKVDDTLDAIADALQDYYRDVGSLPAGNDSVGLAELLSSSAPGWAGPYLRGRLSEIVRDPWGSLILLRPCTQVNGEAVTGRLLLSPGPGPPDASAWGQAWTTGADDIFRVVRSSHLQSLLDRRLIDQARRELPLQAAQIYVSSPSQSPSSGVRSDSDPWGQRYLYLSLTQFSGIVYSCGPNRTDESGSGDDIYESLLWQPPAP